MKNSPLFVTAIGTDSGKTVVSAILVTALDANYWKPIQSGRPRDTEQVQQLTGLPASRFFEEKYLFDLPASPHAAAAAEDKHIDIADILLPESDRPLVIEGAGGLLVPLNQQELMADLVGHLKAEIILVSNLYLGSINHTLLTISELKRRTLPVKGLIFNGPPNEASQQIIEKYAAPWPVLLHVQPHSKITPNIVNRYAEKIKPHLLR